MLKERKEIREILNIFLWKKKWIGRFSGSNIFFQSVLKIEHLNTEILGSYFLLLSSMVLFCTNQCNTPAKVESHVLTFGLTLPRKFVKSRVLTEKRRGTVCLVFSDLTHTENKLGCENTSSRKMKDPKSKFTNHSKSKLRPHANVSPGGCGDIWRCNSLTCW